jgi:hypothetical protein
MIFLGVAGRAGLGGAVNAAEASVHVLWVAMKVLKWALGLLLVLVVLGGLIWAVREFLG